MFPPALECWVFGIVSDIDTRFVLAITEATTLQMPVIGTESRWISSSFTTSPAALADGMGPIAHICFSRGSIIMIREGGIQ